MSTDNRVRHDRLKTIDWLTVALVFLSILIAIALASWALDSAASLTIVPSPDLAP